MQSKTRSLVEQLFNIGSGFLISLLVWEFFIKPIWEIDTSFNENIHITAVFTVVSIARSYAWRRLFNRLDNNKNKASHETTDWGGGPSPRG